MTLQRIRIDEINFGNRHRKEMGDLKGLAGSIKTLGMLNPITVAKVNGGYLLLAGARRLKAKRDILGESMIEANVVKFAKPLEHLLIEKHENDERLPFAPSEMVAIGKSIEAQLGERRGRPAKELDANASNLDSGKTSEIASEASGFKSHDTYERAKKVVEEGTPELVEAMDKKQVSIADAAAVADAPKKDQRAAVAAVKQGKTRTARAAVKPRSKSGKVVFDDRPIDQAIGKLTRMLDSRGNKVGKTAEYKACLEAMEKVLASWRRWQKAST